MSGNISFLLRANGRSPVEEYIQNIGDQRQIAAIQVTIERLAMSDGRLPMPIAKHVEGKIWELRTRFGNQVFYCRDRQNVILIDGYTKKRDRIEPRILERVRHLYTNYLTTRKIKPY